jgi:hypothetical protein
MSKFKCTNENCEDFEKVVTMASVRYFFDEKSKTLKPKDKDVLCAKCEKVMSEIKNETNGDINFYFGSFNSKSDKEKKRILKKRADDHTRSKMSDRVHSIKKKFGVI